MAVATLERAITPSSVLTREEVAQRLKEDAALLRAEFRIRRKELKLASEKQALDAVLEILLALIRQPATGLVMGIAACELIEMTGLFSSRLTGIVEAMILTGSTVTAIGNVVSTVKGAIRG